MDNTENAILISNIVIALCIRMVPDNFTNFWEHNTHKPGVTAQDSTRKCYICFLFSKFCTLYSLFYPLYYDCWQLFHLHSEYHYFCSRQHCIIVSIKAITVRLPPGIPVQNWTGPESNRRLILPDFKTINT